MKIADYSYPLAEEDKIRIAFRSNRGKVEHFVVQHFALINSRWRSIMRFDTCHGYAHKHTFHFVSKEHVVSLTAPGGELNEVFDQSSRYVKNNFEKIKRNYLST